MNGPTETLLAQALDLSPEPFVVFDTCHSGWPVRYRNPAFSRLFTEQEETSDFETVLARLFERPIQLDISEAVRTQSSASTSVRLSGNDFLLELQPLPDQPACYAMWLHARSPQSSTQAHSVLSDTRKKTDTATRTDAVTGLLTEEVFRDVLRHDWAVAQREGSRLCLLVFRIQSFDEYRTTFGKHGADSCLKKVGQTLRSRLRRASDIVARAGDERFLVLSHAPVEENIEGFAQRISDSVRELGLHHPKSSEGRFVSVEARWEVAHPAEQELLPDEVVDRFLG